MKISSMLGKERRAARQLSPAQQTELTSLHGRFSNIEENLREAKAALEKWLQGERFDPQINNLVYAIRNISKLANAAMTISERLSAGK